MGGKKHAKDETDANIRRQPDSFGPRRRLFIKSVTLLLASPMAAPFVAGCTPDEDALELHASDLLSFFTQHEADTLTQVGQDLFPHTALPVSVYKRVTVTLDSLATSNADIGALLRRSIRALDKLCNGQWHTASLPQRHAALEQWQQGEQFGLILNTSIDTLYRDPDVWQLIGYEGSSLEHGGYIDRGFDDINWLADVKQASDQ